jgi:putative sterol carrier protein
MTLDKLTEGVRRRAAQSAPLGHRVRLDLGPAGSIHLDGTTTPAAVSNDRLPADTTVTLSPDALAHLLDGTLDPTLAYMTGRLKIAGSLSVAMRLGTLLAD